MLLAALTPYLELGLLAGLAGVAYAWFQMRSTAAEQRQEAERLAAKVQQLETREDQFRRVIAGAQCILWDATVEQRPDGELDWKMRILTPDFVRSQLGLPTHVQPDDSAQWRMRLNRSEIEEMSLRSRDAIIGGKSSYRQEFTLQQPDGAVRIMREDVQIVPAGAGRWTLIGVQIDITQFKRAQEELGQERDLLHALLDNMPDQIYFKDADSHFVRINRGTAQTLGIERPEEAIGCTDFDFFTASEAQAFRRDDEEVIKGRKLLRDHVELAVRNGRELWMSTTKAPVLGKDGQAVGLVGISRDITDRIRAEQELQRERDLLSTLMDSMPDQIYFKDIHGHFVRVNYAVERDSGLAQGETIVGKTDYDIMPREQAERIRSEELAIMASREPVVDKVETGRFRGEQAWLSCTKAPILDSSGRAIGIVGVNRDITQRKMAEEALKDVVTRAQCILWRAEVTDKPAKPSWNLHVFSAQNIRSMLGMRPGVSDGEAWYKHLLDEDRQLMDKRSTDALRQGLPGYSQEFRMRTEDGTVLWMYETVQISPKGPGRWSLVGVVTDITERRRAEERIRENEARLRLLVEQMPALLWTVDEQMRFTSSVGSGLEALGLKPNQTVGMSLAEYFKQTPTGERVIQFHQRALAGERISYEETWQDLHFQTHLEAQRSADGRINGVVGLAFNITEVKRAEAALREREHLLRQVLDTNPNIIFLKDRQGRILLANQALAAFYQVPIQETVGAVEAVLHRRIGGDPQDLERWAATDSAVLDSGQPAVFTEEIHRQGQSKLWARTKKLPLTVYGNTPALLVVVEDITDIKETESQLAEANAQLNRLAREDALTGLLNRRMIIELVDREWERWRRFGKRFSVLILDADNFKQINDRHGHQTGDLALKFLAARIAEAVRAVDIVGRYGGEEFVVILPETHAEGALAAAEKILANVSKNPMHSEDGPLNLTVSIGSAVCRPEDGSYDMLLNRADMALLQAKRSGKNRVIPAER